MLGLSSQSLKRLESFKLALDLLCLKIIFVLGYEHDLTNKRPVQPIQDFYNIIYNICNNYKHPLSSPFMMFQTVANIIGN